MFHSLKCSNRRLITGVYQLSLIIFTIKATHSQGIFDSQIVSSDSGYQFFPVNVPAQLISTILTSSFKRCAIACNTNVLCRVFDYGVNESQQCRLFEGNTDTLGDIGPSSSPQSKVGTIQISADLFAAYGLPCSSFCQESRYLTCGIVATCTCMPHTYWNALTSTCDPQLPVLGASCQFNISMCREDLNYTCLPFNQCGPAELLIGTTVAGYDNGSAGSDAAGLNTPRGIYVSPLDEALYVSDSFNYRAQRFAFGMRIGATVAGGNGLGGGLNQVQKIWGIFADSLQNVYVGDVNNNRAACWPQNATQSTVVADGAKMWGVTLDQYGNLYTSANDLHVVLRNNDTVVAGTLGVSGNASSQLKQPRGIFFDNQTSSLYVCDTANQRIMKFRMNSSLGITVAGGNGAGGGPHQLNNPGAVWVSSKTGFIYIADSANHRIQRWKMNDTQGVTIAGTGHSGNHSTMLNQPNGVALNGDETFLYVGDQLNHRVQRFTLLV